MSRWIDADRLRELFDENLVNVCHDVVLKVIEEAPSIELIPCRECAKRKKNKFCLEHMRYEKDDDGFCSYGEREERQRLEGKNWTAALTMEEARNEIDILSWEQWRLTSVYDLLHKAYLATLRNGLWKPWGIVASPLLIHKLMSEAIDHPMEIRMEADGTDTIFGLVIIPCEICENDKVHIVDEKIGRALLAGRKGGSNGREYGKDQM